jgi:hypothetical protein
VIIKFRVFGTSSDSTFKEICNAIINNTAIGYYFAFCNSLRDKILANGNSLRKWL